MTKSLHRFLGYGRVRVMKKAQFSKLKSGKWGVKLVGEKPEVGETVETITKDGKTGSEKIVKLIWSGEWEGQTVHLCTIDEDDEDRVVRKGNGAQHHVPNFCPNCGHCLMSDQKENKTTVEKKEIRGKNRAESKVETDEDVPF